MDKRRLLWLFNKGSGLVYLLRVEFSTDDDAPISNPYVGEVGSLVVTDTGSRLSVANGNMDVAAIATNAGFITQSFSKTVGRGLYWKQGGFSDGGFGFRNSSVLSVSYSSMSLGWQPSGINIYDGSFFTGGLAALERFIVLGDTRHLFIGKSGSDWKLVFVSAASVANTLYGHFTTSTNNYAKSGAIDFIKLLDLSTPFDTDYGVATNRVASPAVNETTTSEANALIEMTWTAATGETWEFMTRQTDDNNCWIVRGDQAGSTIKLIEKNAGVETERSSAAQTWTNGVQYRLVVIQDGNTIQTYVANVAKNTYASASFNNTATGVKTNKSGLNLVTYPRTLSGAALTELQRWTS